MNRLIILAPNDRYNYGDLIFSHIIKWQLSDVYDDFINVATIENDLTSVGGDKVHGISYLYHLPENDTYDLIVAGGESLFSNWAVCLSYLSGKYGFLPIFSRLLRKLCNENIALRIENKLGAALFHARTQYPYTIGKKELPFINKLFYNAVGGNSLSKDFISKENTKLLKTIDYLSVRDNNAYKLLCEEEVPCSFVPDSAILMSDLYPREKLKYLISTTTQQFVESVPNYVVFQINKFIGLNNLDSICNLLQKIHIEFGVNILLCPIGYAMGHEDPVALSEIAERINKPYIHMPQNILSVWDIMYLIASSELFIGSSLHGVITAMSFNVPYIGLKVKKTINYIKSWGIKELSYSFNLDVSEMIKCKLEINNNAQLENNSNKQKNISLDSFEKIRKIRSNK